MFFEDAYMDLAIQGVACGILLDRGQVCSAGSRILVQESFYEKFMERAKEEFREVRVGDPLNPETQMGAQVNERQIEKILKYVVIRKEKEADCSPAPYLC